MKKSAFISDVLFICGIAGIFTLCLFRYFSLSFFLSVCLAFLCAFLAGCSATAFLLHKRKNITLKRSNERQKQDLLRHLCLLSDEKKTEYLRDAFSKITQTPLQKSGKLRMGNENDLYFLKFRFSPVTADEVASAARWKSGKQKILLCNEIEESAAALCLQLDIRLQTGESVYQALKSANALPQSYLGQATKKTRKEKRKLWFSKRNAKGFFTGGVLLLLTSLLTPFPYYYLVFGGILLLVSLFVRIFGYE
jgi:hypothetical protein